MLNSCYWDAGKEALSLRHCILYVRIYVNKFLQEIAARTIHHNGNLQTIQNIKSYKL